MEKGIQAILKENEARQKNLFPEYDPIRGIGSPIERVSFQIADNYTVNIPKQMANDNAVIAIMKYGTLEKFAIAEKRDFAKEILPAFLKVREKYDFEYWASDKVWIRAKTQRQDEEDKENEEKSIVIKMVLNKAQRKFLKILETLRLAGKPIRIILLKARQWGGSTLVEMYIAWLQLFWVKQYNSLIVADVQSQSKHVLGMYDFMAQNYNPKIELVPYMRTQNYRMIKGQINIIGVASVQNPDAPRSYTWQLLHLTEVGSWKSTTQISAENLITTLAGGLVEAPYTLLVLESTAQGMGNYFHKEWIRAESGKSNNVPVFVSWIEQQDTILTWDEIKSDAINFPGIKTPDDFVETWDEYERYLWTMGATIEQIAWYRKKLRSYPNRQKMWQQHPTTAKEAFESTGARVFSRDRVAYARSTSREPLATGIVVGRADKGKDALKELRFAPSLSGPLNIWTFPNQAGIEKPGKRYTNRYAAFADTGGKRDEADYSVLKVLDRIWTILGGVPQVCAEFRGHLDPDLFAWQCVQICKWYDNAYFAIEMNKMTSEKYGNDDPSEPDYGLTVMDEIKDHYNNLFYRVRPEVDKEHWDGVIGFWTNQQTKQLIVNTLDSALRDQDYEERSLIACNEMDIFEHKPGGKMGAVEGGNDDTVIGTGGVLWLSNQMPPVEEVDAVVKKAKKAKAGYGVFS